jgi:methylmalonyl-CoA mutase C-terminal domain/subunit
VIYTGLRKTPEYIARIAVEEDVDAVGLSLLSGSHNELVADTLRCLRAMGGDDIAVFVGGTIPAEDHAALTEAGVRGVFTADRKLDDVVATIDKELGA